MSNSQKRWQTHIWLGESFQRKVIFYGDSLTNLRQAVVVWLQEHKPTEFSNTNLTYNVPRQIKQYYYSDGHRLMTLRVGEPPEPLEKGWYYTKGNANFGELYQLDDFDQAVTHFVEQALLVEAGPEYKDDVEIIGAKGWRTISLMIYGMVTGGIVAMCYLAIPNDSQGRNQLLFAIAQGQVWQGVVFIVTMVIGFGILGGVLPIVTEWWQQLKK